MNQFARQPQPAGDQDMARPAGVAALEVEALCRTFGKRPAVDDVDLTVARGEMICLLGPSGCGKSTMLRMIAGIERPDSGRISAAGRTLSDKGLFVPPETRAIGMVFQDFALFPHLDVAANVGFGLPGGARASRVMPLLDRVGMARHARKFPHELSGGEQQRVALARALAPGPGLMLLDEPFSSLDQRLRDEVRDATLTLLRESGTTAIMVTHDPDEAMLMADRIAVMRGGRLIQTAAPRLLYDHPADRHTAEFFSDINVLDGYARGGHLVTALGAFPAPHLEDGSAGELVIRQHHLTTSGPDGTNARVTRARHVGHETLIDLQLVAAGLPLRLWMPGRPAVNEGEIVPVSALPGKALVFAAA